MEKNIEKFKKELEKISAKYGVLIEGDSILDVYEAPLKEVYYDFDLSNGNIRVREIGE